MQTGAINLMSDETRSFFNQYKYIIISGAVGIFLLIIAYMMFYQKVYTLDESISYPSQMIPAEAYYYIEFKDPQNTKSIINKTKFGQILKSNSAYQNFFSSYDFNKFLESAYFLGIKLNEIITYEDLIQMSGGGSGMAYLPDGSYLFVAKLNPASRIGAEIVNTFNKPDELTEVQKVPEKIQTTETEGENQEEQAVANNSYRETTKEQVAQESNIQITTYKKGKGEMFMALLGDYIFLSTSRKTLLESLDLAGNANGASVFAMDKMAQAIKEYKTENSHILLYLRADNNTTAPFMKLFSPEMTAMIGVVQFDEKSPLQGKLYLSGIRKEKSKTGQEDFTKILPRDVPIAFFSQNFQFSTYYDNLKDSESNNLPYKAGLKQLFQAAGLNEKTAFGSEAGIGMLFHGFTGYGKRIYPEATILYRDEDKSATLFQSIFKKGSGTNASVEKLNYTYYGRAGLKYTPSVYNGENSQVIVSTSRNSMEEVLSASSGNRPVVADFEQIDKKKLGQYGEHLVLNLPELRDTFFDFLNYGADNSGEYSQKTIENDLIPLWEPLNDYSLFHMAVHTNTGNGDADGEFYLN